LKHNTYVDYDLFVKYLISYKQQDYGLSITKVSQKDKGKLLF